MRESTSLSEGFLRTRSSIIGRRRLPQHRFRRESAGGKRYLDDWRSAGNPHSGWSLRMNPQKEWANRESISDSAAQGDIQHAEKNLPIDLRNID